MSLTSLPAEPDAANPILDAGCADHTVQFYESDGFLVEVVAEYTKAGLDQGEPVVLIATASHRELLGRELERRDIGVVASAKGRLTFLDSRP